MSKESEKSLTPLMKQYWDIKSLHADKILFFRMGDFFELFYDDATTAAPLLGITLTQRNKKSEDQTPMCGMPHHSVANPINKLLSLGYKVALCDQVEDPKTAKGIVKRAITRILTPGMVYDPDTLDSTMANYMAAVDEKSVAFVDVSTGESFYYEAENVKDDFKAKWNLLNQLPVVEIVVTADFKSQIPQGLDILVTEHNCEFSGSDLETCQLLVSYIQSLSQHPVKDLIRPFERRSLSHRMMVSANTIRHLEIFQTYKGAADGSLFDTINKTKTSAGARLFRQNLLFPLRDVVEIKKRQDKVALFKNNLFELKKIREILVQMGDLERRLTKMSLPQAHARDLLSLADSMQAGMGAVEVSEKLFPHQLNLVVLSQLVNEIKQTIVEEPPLTVKQGHIIQKGIHSELDEYILLTSESQQLLQTLENKEKEATGISSLKVRYNNVFGYYIEVTNTHKDKVPAHYQRKQTLTNAERYCTDELIELEKKVLSAQSKRYELEFQIFDQLRLKVIDHASDILSLSKQTSELDFYTSLAWLSLENHYCRPEFSTNQQLHLTESRHAVVEQFQKGRFVSNEIRMDQSECYLITGPNMAGKSTLMRQVALTVLLAQMGSDVPASTAVLPLYDSIHTRIGASDQLSEGLSTFMVEMTETAALLQEATPQSLLILDEIGRGTATFDGLCLAQAILEHVLQNIQAHTFFATHYHELTDLQTQYPNQLKNVHMKIVENKGHIEFLYVLKSGPAGKSYGIQVAELAGLPNTVTQRAFELLAKIETAAPKTSMESSASVAKPVQKQISFFDQQTDQNKDELYTAVRNLDVLKISPLEALNRISEWKEKYLNS